MADLRSSRVIMYYIILGLLLAGAFYVLWWPTDVALELLRRQASRAAVRLPGESVVLRSLDNPHGEPLLAELLGRRLERFSFADLWEPESFRVRETGTTVELTQMVSQVAGSVRGARHVLACVPLDSMALALVFACGLQNIELTLADFIPQNHDADLVLTSVPLGPPLDLQLKTPFQNPSRLNFVLESKIYRYTPGEIGLAIGSQLRSLGHHMWTPRDKVLVRASGPYGLLMQLTALAAKAELMLGEPNSESFGKPSVIVTEDDALRQLLQTTQGVMLKPRQSWSQLLLAHGKLRGAMRTDFASVRLLHTAPRASTLSNREANLIRALTGTQLLHTYATPSLFIPVAQTMVGDYPSRLGASFGPPNPGLQVKIRTGLLHVSYDDDHWLELGPAELLASGVLHFNVYS